ncbi:MAG: hypothetical protein ACRC3Z_05860 [Phocaeicola sp.]
MKDKILSTVAKSAKNHHFDELTGANHKEIYIIDWKSSNDGPVQWSPTLPVQWNEDAIDRGALITNPNGIDFTIDLFDENALPLHKGRQAKQCECLLFPTNYELNSWVLLVELKYAKNQRTLASYKENLKEKAIENVNYFREKEIIPHSKRVNILVSFPNFDVEVYGPYIFDPSEVDNLLTEHNIKLRVSDRAKIVSETKIMLGV